MAPQDAERTESTLRTHPAALRLPPEIVKIICDHAPNSTIKNLRLTRRFYLINAGLRLSRVFISANTRNVEVFVEIAKNPFYRQKITEIIWDDGTLHIGDPAIRRGTVGQNDGHDDAVDSAAVDDIVWSGDGVPAWFRNACELNIWLLNSLKGNDVDRPGHIDRARQVAAHMPMEEAWAYYRYLLYQQDQTEKSQAHVRALEENTGLFNNLRRITITPAAHGRLFNPLYETPMIRAFPPGFNFFISRNWLVADPSGHWETDWHDEGPEWQGLRVVTRILAENKSLGNMTEVRIDSNTLETGLNPNMFLRENPTLANFETALSRSNFRHLHLDLMVNREQATIYQKGLLKRALAGAAGGQGLVHLSLGANIPPVLTWSRAIYMPLETILPTESFTRLQHFGLSRLQVEQGDLLSLLGSLPLSLRTLELIFLRFNDDGGSYRSLLEAIRHTLGWGQWEQRPRLKIGALVDYMLPECGIWLADDIDDFLYHGGPNPFGDGSRGIEPHHVQEGFGIVKDPFDPENERPYTDISTLAKIGYLDRGLTRLA